MKQQIIQQSKWGLKCPHDMQPIGICVHNTANKSTAQAEIDYMQSNSSSTSFHIAVDENEAIQGLPLDRNAWHAGDGASGTGNRKYIAIEICRSTNQDWSLFAQAELNAAKLIAKMLKERSWSVENVKKHQDFSGKNCPHKTLEWGWDRFIKMVQDELDALNKPAKSQFYRVQTGSFSVKSNADRLSNELAAKGYQNFVNFVDGNYKVQVGAYSIKENAERMKQNLINAGYSAFITQ